MKSNKQVLEYRKQLNSRMGINPKAKSSLLDDRVVFKTENGQVPILPFKQV